MKNLIKFKKGKNVYYSFNLSLYNIFMLSKLLYGETHISIYI